MKKLGRNDLCWCGSGKKYKHCHEAFDEKLMEAADAGHQIPDHDMIKTLEQIEGIGDKTVQTLLRHFRTVEKVRAANIEELSALVGPAKAKKIKAFFEK